MLLIVFVCLFCLLSPCVSYSVEIKAGQKECFLLSSTKGKTLSGSYEVMDEDPEPITVKVTGVDHSVLYESSYSGPGAIEGENSEGQFDFDAEKDGDYKICFRNGKKSENDGTSRLIAFNFREIDIDAEDFSVEGKMYAGLENELYDLQRGLDFLTDHQSYVNQREVTIFVSFPLVMPRWLVCPSSS